MSLTEKVSNNNQLFVDYDNTKLLLGFNEFNTGVVTASGADVDLVKGMVLGRISGTTKIVPLAAASTDGSQYPAGFADHRCDGSVHLLSGRD